MADAIICKLCHKRRAKRSCPAVHGAICALCCGEQREITLFCPLECQFLREAHKHEKTLIVSVEQISNPDVEVSEEFIRSREELLLFSVYSLVQAGLRTPHAVDTDVLEALAALIQTRRTEDSGLIYQTVAENTVAATIQRRFADSLKSYEQEREQTGSLPAHRDSDIFKILVFLHRIGQQNLNGRPKGRMFIDMLRSMTPDTGVDERAPSIIL
jgi:hypothetical protein